MIVSCVSGQAALVDYTLTIDEKQVAPAGRSVRGLTINGTIPGPTLRFREGDTARIHVRNALAGEPTSLHWHGLLLPNNQDGVPFLTGPAVAPGQTLTYEFPLVHSGTYWYHSHSGLQEQQGLFGALIVEPRGGEPVKTNHEEVVIFSDWTNENPTGVMRRLMSGTSPYSIRKGNQQSILGAIKAGALKEFWEREWTRMPAMDISDVAYDAFLFNGQRSLPLKGKPGEKIRLRFINGSASTYCYLQFSGGPMQIVAADGPAVKPVPVERLLVSVAETYDLVITIPGPGAWELRATAMDGSGHVSALIGDSKAAIHPAADVPKPDNYRMDEMLLAAIEDKENPNAKRERPLSPYHKLRSRNPTTLPASAPRREMTLRLTGDMERYIWSFNGKTLAEDSRIPVQKGEVLKFILINDTMMHHPMHLHGHFFRVLDGNDDAHAPLKNTLDVPPMGQRTIEFLADQPGNWFFHCHLLYHMDAGMARVISYETPGQPPPSISLDPAMQDPFYFMLEGSLQNHMTMGMATLMDARNDFTFMWDVGFHDHDVQVDDMDHAEDHPDSGDPVSYEVDFHWRRYFNPNFSTLTGYRLTNYADSKDRFFAGALYRLPLLVNSEITLDSEGDLRVSLEKSLHITNRTSLHTEVEYDTGSGWEWSAEARWFLSNSFSLVGGYHSHHGWGGGLGFRF